MHQCWHPEPKGRPKFSDLHRLFDYFLTRHTQESYPYIDMDSNIPYMYDHLLHKTISDYPSTANQEVVLNLDEEEAKTIYIGEGESSDYGSAKDLGIFSSDETLTETAATESGCFLSASMKTDAEVVYDQLRTLDHPYLTRISNSIPDVVVDYGGFIDEDDYYSQDNNNDQHLSPYDVYNNNLWMKKLSTITEVSFEDYSEEAVSPLT